MKFAILVTMVFLVFSLMCGASGVHAQTWDTFSVDGGNPAAKGLSFTVKYPAGALVDDHRPEDTFANIRTFSIKDRRTMFFMSFGVGVAFLSSLGVTPDDFKFGSAWLAWSRIAGSSDYDSLVHQGRPAADIYHSRRDGEDFSFMIVRNVIEGERVVRLTCFTTGDKATARKERIEYWNPKPFRHVCKPFLESLDFR
jgi:hypothetical protein